ncbi:MAG: hypothetical protein LLG06_15760 [Desulfobacteraceae bacterium]|nr:hypothetical protein [Desulfobacteraceae bacterium]
MKAGIIFTGTGPILILTSYQSFDDPNFVEKLATKGIQKYIAYELPVEKVKAKYREQFLIIMQDLSQANDLRVLDYNGHHVFTTFSLKELGPPIYSE